MKKSLLYMFLLLSVGLFSQTRLQSQKSFVIVPFSPNLYFNDLSRIWHKTGESRSQDQQIRDISNTIMSLIGDSLSMYYDVFDLNDVPSTYSNVDYFDAFRNITGYAYHDTLPQRKQKGLERLNKRWTKLKKKDRSSMGELRAQNKERQFQFFGVTIKDKIKFRRITKDLNCDYVLFINQVEVKGDFSSPYLNGNERNYKIMLHYSIFNRNAKLIVGNKTSVITSDQKSSYKYFINTEIPRAVIQIVGNISKNIKMSTIEVK